jgi:Bacterial DNA-binding protein
MWALHSSSRTGHFLPGLAMFQVTEKTAIAAHDGINPFTKEPMMVEANPARKVIKVRLLKVVKDAIAGGSQAMAAWTRQRWNDPSCRP